LTLKEIIGIGRKDPEKTKKNSKISFTGADNAKAKKEDQEKR
jgi:hypothetical protein